MLTQPIEVFKFFQSKPPEELKSIEDIGPEVARSIFEYFHDQHNEDFVHKLDKASVKIKLSHRPASTSLGLAGKTFVLTGILSSMTRDEAKGKIRQFRGEISESISKKTSYVVAGKEPGSKHEKAKKLGLKIIREPEFLTMLKWIELDFLFIFWYDNFRSKFLRAPRRGFRKEGRTWKT